MSSTSDINIVQLVEGCNQFACDLYSVLAADNSENLFFSPSSISMALAMTSAGAAGTTAYEIEKTLHVNNFDHGVHTVFKRLIAHVQTSEAGLHTANRLWGQVDFQFLPDYLSTTKECYDSEIGLVDFKHAPENSRQSINTWCEEQTSGLIKGLLPDGIISELTRLVLTNAIHFKGSWKNAFDLAQTKSGVFHRDNIHHGSCSLMTQTGQFKMGGFEQLQVLELPYKVENESDSSLTKNNLVMWILLPCQQYRLESVEQKLSSDALDLWSPYETEEVHVSIPKFNLTFLCVLKEMLEKLGIQSAFSQTEADFSLMSNEEPGLYIDDVVHKANVEVNEEGTEAAAATGVVMAARVCAPTIFRADHPFIFLIRDSETGLIHFMGRVMKP